MYQVLHFNSNVLEVLQTSDGIDESVKSFIVELINKKMKRHRSFQPHINHEVTIENCNFDKKIKWHHAFKSHIDHHITMEKCNFNTNDLRESNDGNTILLTTPSPPPLPFSI